MRIIFVDTGAFYALVDAQDPAHSRAKEFYAGYQGAFLTTDFIVAETMSLVTKRLGKRLAVSLGESIRASRRFRVAEPSPSAREAAWTLFAGRLDQDYALIDCVSFKIMEAWRITEAFGFDRHFVQHGFRLLPG